MAWESLQRVLKLSEAWGLVGRRTRSKTSKASIGVPLTVQAKPRAPASFTSASLSRSLSLYLCVFLSPGLWCASANTCLTLSAAELSDCVPKLCYHPGKASLTTRGVAASCRDKSRLCEGKLFSEGTKSWDIEATINVSPLAW